MELLSKCISEEANKERWTAKGRIAKRRIPKENIVLNVKEDGVFTRNMAVGQLVGFIGGRILAHYRRVKRKEGYL